MAPEVVATVQDTMIPMGMLQVCMRLDAMPVPW